MAERIGYGRGARNGGNGNGNGAESTGSSGSGLGAYVPPHNVEAEESLV